MSWRGGRVGDNSFHDAWAPMGAREPCLENVQLLTPRSEEEAQSLEQKSCHFKVKTARPFSSDSSFVVGNEVEEWPSWLVVVAWILRILCWHFFCVEIKEVALLDWCACEVCRGLLRLCLHFDSLEEGDTAKKGIFLNGIVVCSLVKYERASTAQKRQIIILHVTIHFEVHIWQIQAHLRWLQLDLPEYDDCVSSRNDYPRAVTTCSVLTWTNICVLATRGTRGFKKEIMQLQKRTSHLHHVSHLLILAHVHVALDIQVPNYNKTCKNLRWEVYNLRGLRRGLMEASARSNGGSLF